jgi:hypothetical protein
MYYNVRGFSIKLGVTGKSIKSYQLFLVHEDKTRTEINHPRLYNLDEAKRIVNYISKKLNLSIETDFEEVFNINKYDDDTFARKGVDPSMSLKNITKDKKLSTKK